MPAFHRTGVRPGVRAGVANRLGRRVLPGRHRSMTLLAGVAALGASLAITACGSSSKGKDGLPNKQEMQADGVKFAKCMREHGVDAEVSTGPGGGVGLSIHVSGKPQGGKGEDGAASGPPPGVEAAQRACKHFLPNEGEPPKLSPAEEAKERQAALKFARCMRSHGVDIPDPGSSGAVEIGGNVDPHTATFEAAQKACQSLIGKLPLRVTSRGPAGGSESGSAGR